MKFLTTSTAIISLNEIYDFLKRRWTKREIAILKNDIKKFKQTIRDGIIKHESVENFPQIKVALIGKKQVKLFYEIKSEEVVVIKLFFHCKQDPRIIKNILKDN